MQRREDMTPQENADRRVPVHRAARDVPPPSGLSFAAAMLGLFAEPSARAVDAAERSPSPAGQQTVTDYLDFTGNTAAIDSVTLVARVEGYLEQIHFTDGARVKKGDLLFTIQQDQYKAQLQQAEAQVAAQKASLWHAKTELARYTALVKEDAATQTEVDRWAVRARRRRRPASSARRRRWSSPSSTSATPGHARRSTGASAAIWSIPATLVGAHGPADVAGADRPIDPIYVYFTIDERDLLRVSSAHKRTPRSRSPSDDDSGLLRPVQRGRLSARGTLDFASLSVAPTTGTLQVRGIFPNPDARRAAGPVRARPRAQPLQTARRAAGSRRRDQLRSAGRVRAGRQRQERGRAQRRQDRPAGRRAAGRRTRGCRPDDRVIVDGLAPGDPRARGQCRSRRRAGGAAPLPTAADRSETGRMSKFFIERPILANVIAIVTIVLGVVCLLYAAGRASIPNIVPPTIQVSTNYPGASADVVATTVGIPIEQARQRRRELDLHAVDERQRRQLHADRDLRGRHRPQYRRSRSCRTRSTAPCRSCRSDVQTQGVTVQKVSTNILLIASLLLGRRPLRRDVSQQLRDHQPAESARAPARRRPGAGARRRTLQHAHLARPAEAQGLRPDGARRAERDPEPERPGRGRTARRTAGAVRSGLPVHGHDARAGSRTSRSSRTSSSRRAPPSTEAAQALEPSSQITDAAIVRVKRRREGRARASRRSRPSPG